MFCMLKKEKVYPAYVSKYNSSFEKVNYSFNDSKWRKMAVKRLLALLRGITSKDHDGFYCLNCFHSFATENKLQRVCENKDFCNIMPSDDTKIIKNLIKHHSLLCRSWVYNGKN